MLQGGSDRCPLIRRQLIVLEPRLRDVAPTLAGVFCKIPGNVDELEGDAHLSGAREDSASRGTGGGHRARVGGPRGMDDKLCDGTGDVEAIEEEVVECVNDG